MNDYKATIIIESNEENEKMEFWIEANSFEEAIESVKEELNI